MKRVFATVKLKVYTAMKKKRSFFVIYGGWWQIPDFYLKLVIEYLVVARPLFELRVDSFLSRYNFRVGNITINKSFAG